MKALFTQILLRAYALGVLRLDDVSLDGTMPVLSEAEGIHANASKHKALSWRYANRLEEQLRVEVDALLKKAEEAGYAEPVAGMKVGEEVALRQAQLQQIGVAKRYWRRVQKRGMNWKKRPTTPSRHNVRSGNGSWGTSWEGARQNRRNLGRATLIK
jgi:hypothetical protein